MKNMKKTLGILVMLCMLLSTALVLSSCGGVSEKDLQNDTAYVLSEALENTLSAFFTDDAGVRRVLDKAESKGSVNVTVASKDFLGGGDLTKLSATLYMDKKGGAYVADSLLTFDGEDYTARIYADKDSVALHSADILGTDKTYLFNPTTFTEGLEGSGLAAYLDMSDKEVAETVRIINAYMEQLGQAPEEEKAEAKAFTDQIFGLLDQSIGTEKVEDENGKTLKYLVATYTFTNKTVGYVLDAYLEEMEASGTYTEEDLSEIEASFNETKAKINETYDINLTGKLYLEPKSNTVAKITFMGTVKGADALMDAVAGETAPTEEETTAAPDAEAARVEAVITFSETEIAATVALGEGDGKAVCSLRLTKETTDTEVAYNGQLTFARAALTLELMNGEYTYSKETGDIAAKLTLTSFGLLRTEYSAAANLAVSKNEATLTMKSLGTKVALLDKTFTFDEKKSFTVTVKAEEEIPVRPEDTEDIIDLSESEWEALEDSFVASPVGILLYGVRLEGSYVKEAALGSQTVLTFEDDTVKMEVFVLGQSVSTAKGTYVIRDHYITIVTPDALLASLSGAIVETNDTIILGSDTFEKQN